jgi:hypothetical protein
MGLRRMARKAQPPKRKNSDEMKLAADIENNHQNMNNLPEEVL